MFEQRNNQKETNEPNQTFTDYMGDFLDSKSAGTVVEVGSDIQLRIALHLSAHCKRMISVNFKEDHKRSMGWYESHLDHGVYNLELKSGNALNLSSMVPQADVVILHNVLLAATEEDTDLLWKYRRNEIEYTKEDWNTLIEKFQEAEVDGYREFLKVAKPGYVVSFKRKSFEEKYDNLFLNKLNINKDKITKINLLYDEDSEEEWILYIIDNT